ncbi:glutaredoxin-like protein C5orf63 homolog isoform X2 [Phyllobates terribilis]|uniref:glutaredoxin-like protein C5orf63 homolog isoform X2 n=1 Tax=Phyllobates terribilis TaxID=111132 RepID=UPI003CCB3993
MDSPALWLSRSLLARTRSTWLPRHLLCLNLPPARGNGGIKTMFHLRHVHRIKHIAFQSAKRHYAQEKPVLTLFTKNPCPLCDEAKEVLLPYMDRFVLEQVDITLPENMAWYDRYKHDIPVFHLNGQFLMMHRVNIKKLERYLSKLEQEDDVK